MHYDKEREDYDKELNVLFPDLDLKINGEKITIKEYTLMQQLQHRDKLMPFVESIRSTLSEDEAEFNLDALIACLSEHSENVIELIALSINKPSDYVANLTGEEAENLMMAWWTVNSDFFTRKAVQPLLEKLAKKQNKILAGAKLLNK
ncbi:hypothetical protein QJU96_10005 [Pasteurella skyensis]|uniref:Uncharacterized protein n=1 Tax=Phocoenobacter skyensis TaxID=97481 RepID=A0AAJ6NER3_9PAST|nr:DUF6631 family protein [Pasteurella skyensis]MDP8171615.1 hypothetical protein [Pasteurella skyensis]MDP8175451.1 hypothetical protein [Pasteurella skyensis]